MTDTTRDTPSYAQYAREQYADTVEATVRRLRETVDRFERTALDTRGRDSGRSSDHYPHATAAARALHELHWGIANASVDSLMRDAAEADHSTREDADRG